MNEEISRATEHLNNGGIILYPCDTIWGIGCDATNQKAIDKIYDIKKRKPTSPLICLMSDFKMVEKYLSISSKIKSFRPPEPYKGKGIKEKGQYILRKEGKKK